MPCYRCGERQTDPSRGESPWRRGVRNDSQVLICPGCQTSADWTADLDRCSQCSSVHLVRRLGEVECRDCGAIVPPADDQALALTLGGQAPGLSEEVARALDRVLGRGLVSQGGSARGPAGS